MKTLAQNCFDNQTRRHPIMYSRFVILLFLGGLVSVAASSNTNNTAASLDPWGSVNALLQGVSIPIPNQYNQNAGRYLNSNLLVDITNTSCSNIHFQDIQLSGNETPTHNSSDIQLTVLGFTLNCTFDWRYTWSFFHGSGSNSTIYSNDAVNNRLQTTFQASTSIGSFNLGNPPDQSSTTQCLSSIHVTDINFQRKDVVSSILNLLESFLRGTIGNKIQDAVCKTLTRFGNVTLSDWLEHTATGIKRQQSNDSVYNDTMDNNLIQDELEFMASNSAMSNRSVDLSNLETNAGPLIGFAWREIQKLFSIQMNRDRELVGTSNSSQSNTQINTWIRNFFLDPKGGLEISVNRNFTLTRSNTIQLIVKSIRLSGLDTITHLDPFILLPESNFTFQSMGQLTHLGVAIDATALIKFSSNIWNESFTFSSDIQDPSAYLITSLILNKDKLGSIQIGSLSDFQRIVTSLLQSSNLAKIMSLYLDIDLINSPTFSGLATQAEEDVASTAISILYGMFKIPLTQAISGYLKRFLNKYAHEIIQQGPSVYQNTTFMKDGYINFGDMLLPENDAIVVGGTGKSPYGKLFYGAKNIIDKQVLAVDPTSGLSKVNKLVIDPLTKMQSNISGFFSLPGTLFEKEVRLKVGDISGQFQLRLFGAAISNIDTLNGTSRLLKPISEHKLENRISFDRLNATISAKISFVSSSGDMLLNDTISLGVDAFGLKLYFILLMIIREQNFLSFPLRNCRDLNCWLTTLRFPTLDEYGLSTKTGTSLSVSEVEVLVDDFHFSMQCLSCTNQIAQYISDTISSPAKQEDVNHILRQLLDPGMKMIIANPLQKFIDQAVYKSRYKCPDSASYQRNYTSSQFKPIETRTNMITWTAMSLAILLLLILCYVVFLSAFALRRFYAKRTIASESNIRMHMYASEQYLEKSYHEVINVTFPALRTNQYIPLLLRILIPIILVGNFANLFLGHISNAVNIQILFKLSTLETALEIYHRSIAQVILELWNASVEGVAAIIFFLLLILPYIQQSVALCLWMTQPRYISVETRENIFRAIIVLSKWNLLPLFMFNITTTAVNITFNSPSPFISYLTPTIISAQPRVYPEKGMYMFLSAQFVLQCTCLTILHYHRLVRIISAQSMMDSPGALPSGDEEAISLTSRKKYHDSMEPLRNHHFYRGAFISEEYYTIRRGVSTVIVLFSSLTLSFSVWGFFAPLFDIAISGVVGAYLTKVSQSYSAYDIIANIFLRMHTFQDAADKVGTGFLSFLIICVIAVPVTLLVVQLVRWFAPLSRMTQTKFLTAVEVLDTFQYLDMYIVGLVISNVSIRSVSNILNRKCGAITEILASIAQSDISLESNRQCVQVISDLRGSTFLLVIAAIILWILKHFIASAASHQESDFDRAAIASTVLKSYNVESQQIFSSIERRNIILRFNDYYYFLLEKKKVEETQQVEE